jgi:hypothetical protein
MADADRPGGTADVEGRTPLRDEVNEPLGVWPVQQSRSSGAGWTLLAVVAPAVAAVAMAAFTFGGYDARRRALAAEAEARLAPMRADPSPPAQSKPVERPAGPPIAAADRIDAPTGAKVTPNGVANTPTPLIIDVQQALAAQKARSAPVVPR